MKESLMHFSAASLLAWKVMQVRISGALGDCAWRSSEEGRRGIRAAQMPVGNVHGHTSFCPCVYNFLCLSSLPAGRPAGCTSRSVCSCNQRLQTS